VVAGLYSWRRRFRSCAAYLTECPSRSFYIRQAGRIGSRLRQRRAGLARRGFALDMVRLEWADIEAFRRAASPPVAPEERTWSPACESPAGHSTYVQLLYLHFRSTIAPGSKTRRRPPDRAATAVQERRKTTAGSMPWRSSGRRNLLAVPSSISRLFSPPASRKVAPFSPRCKRKDRRSRHRRGLSAKFPSLRPTARLLFNVRCKPGPALGLFFRPEKTSAVKSSLSKEHTLEIRSNTTIKALLALPFVTFVSYLQAPSSWLVRLYWGWQLGPESAGASSIICPTVGDISTPRLPCRRKCRFHCLRRVFSVAFSSLVGRPRDQGTMSAPSLDAWLTLSETAMPALVLFRSGQIVAAAAPSRSV